MHFCAQVYMNHIHTMFTKYLRLYPSFVECGFPEETKRLIPHYAEHEEIITLTEQLKEFQVNSKWLQSTDVAIQINGENKIIPVNHFNIRTCFDSLIARYPCMSRHLGKNASIAHSPDFENAITKMQGNLPYSRLTAAEKSLSNSMSNQEKKRRNLIVMRMLLPHSHRSLPWLLLMRKQNKESNAVALTDKSDP